MRFKRARRCLLLLMQLLSPGLLVAQGGWMEGYRTRLAATQREQPHWATPLVTVNPRLEQGFRADFVRQTSVEGKTSWNYGNTKGLQFVPLRRVEVRLSPPAFVMHSDGKTADGFGDVAGRIKYRFYGSSEEHHNALVTGTLAASLPTGKHANGSCCAVLSPNLLIGKGIGRLAVVASAGGSLPVSGTAKLGRSIVWNNALAYHVTRLVWVETEFNSTFFFGGRSDGKVQTFVTPGVVVSRIPLVRGRAGRPDLLQISLGAGEQIALTRFHSYDHSPIFTVRLRF